MTHDVMRNYGLIQEPTNMLYSLSCNTDLIFSSQPNLVIETGVHLLLQIVIIR